MDDGENFHKFGHLINSFINVQKQGAPYARMDVSCEDGIMDQLGARLMNNDQYLYWLTPSQGIRDLLAEVCPAAKWEL